MKLNKLVIYVVMMVLLVSFVNAMGLAPAENVIDFKPNLEKELSFRVVNTENKDLELAIQPRGNLAEYIKLEKETVTLKANENEKIVRYSIKLPKELEPGLKTADILVIPTSSTQEPLSVSESTKAEAVMVPVGKKQSIVTAKIALIHQVKVNVPYPGKYLSGILYVDEAEVNERVDFTISLFSLGIEDIDSVRATIIVKGPTNEEIAVIRTDEISLASQDKTKLVGSWLAEVGSGKYYAEVIVEYDGKTLLLDKVFNVGQQYIEIEKLEVDDFRLGTIAKFDILLRSKWNEPITNVYVNMQVIDKSSNLLTDFKTKSMDMQPYASEEVSGYWDTLSVQPGEYDVNVRVYYADRITEKLFETVVSFDSIDVKRAITGRVAAGERRLSDSVLVMIVLILIGINVGWFIYFKRKKK